MPYLDYLILYKYYIYKCKCTVYFYIYYYIYYIIYVLYYIYYVLIATFVDFN